MSEPSVERLPAAAERLDPGYILVVDDEPDIRRLIQEILEDEHYRVVTAENAAQAREAVRRQRPDLVLLDIWMPDTDGISLLKEWSQNRELDMPVVMMSGHGTVETAVEATRLGAYDFIEKPVSLGKLLVTLERALENDKLRRENLRLRAQAEPDAFLVGKSAAMRALREEMERIAAADTCVLIGGEPGSGRAAAARYLHLHSPRRDRPFVEMSFTALTAAEAARQLFGTESGASILPGAFERAGGGTLVLNEIDELDPALQAQLLRALEERRIQRVGGREPLAWEARLMAITHADLKKAAAEGRFREDLYYRLNVVPLRMPALREHREDMPELVNFYLHWLVDHEHLSYCRFTTGALNALRNYTWPGNVRELKNAVQRLLILSRGEEITEAEVMRALGGPAPTVPTAAEALQPLFELPLRAAREHFERAYLEYHLARTGGNVMELARLSGMERTHLYRKLKQLGINPKTLKE
ncbi:MAG: transcriptional regulator [Candidatus Muproteobacteria bacterium RBG_16_65_34]|uniref:Transcriptional regulator n=1 Tax=Candidatus Muproteobacteria bacterium RBG_16_65_34 TaxID=1817760 RepID=A0A1F6TRZ8_9PROT|nr:MAG: transcriptional regulator [Candidatus Muproteobacteria bacterium RBG_16_65_34]